MEPTEGTSIKQSLRRTLVLDNNVENAQNKVKAEIERAKKRIFDARHVSINNAVVWYLNLK